MALEYRHQPAKTLFLLWQNFVVVPLYHFPIWLLTAIPVFFSKEKGNWTLMRHLNASSARQKMYQRYKVGFWEGFDHISLPDQFDGVWIPAVPDRYILGSVKSRAELLGISSVSIPGYWIHKENDIPLGSKAALGEKTILFFHGGGFVSNSAHPDCRTSIVPKTFLKRCHFIRRTFAVEYRLSTAAPLQPANQFPAALLDALAGYLYLIDLGFKAENIIVIGDSAGGHLALTMTKYLIDHRSSGLPNVPQSLVALSPWIDIAESFREITDPRCSSVRFTRYDIASILSGYPIRQMSISFVGEDHELQEESSSNIYISPASPEVLGLNKTARTMSFKGFPRTWIDIGGFECLLDQVRRLRDGMIEDLGPELVQYNEVDGAVHDYLVQPWHGPDNTESYIKISKWLEDGN